MKAYKIKILFFIVIVFFSCHNEPEAPSPAVQVTALVDITDQMLVLPDAETFLTFYDFVNDKNKEAFFRLTTTTDKQLNPAIEHHLCSGEIAEKNNQYDDPDFRNKLVLSFYSTIRQSVSSFNAVTKLDTTLGHSECFHSISIELARMQEIKTDKAILVVYSDLSENSDLYDVYSPEGLQQLLEHPEIILNLFEATKLLPNNLSGFTILFIFQSKDRQQDILFNAMTAVYKKMLTSRGAKVILSANNPKQIQL